MFLIPLNLGIKIYTLSSGLAKLSLLDVFLGSAQVLILSSLVSEDMILNI